MRIERPDEPAPSDEVQEALAAFGLQAEQPIQVEEDFVLWPENAPVLKLWFTVQTQWRTNVAGRATGLDYSGVEAVMRLHQIPRAMRQELFDGLRVMEVATLNELAK